jgi:hypothetical protein
MLPTLERGDPVRRLVLSVVSVVWCASCAGPKAASPGSKIVRTSTPPEHCVLLGPVKGTDQSMEAGKPWEHMQVGPSKNAAIDAALEEAAAKGATHVRLGEMTRIERGFSIDGAAYDCSSRAATPAAPPPAAPPEATPPAWLGCSKDTDCKGDRICRNRECVDP